MRIQNKIYLQISGLNCNKEKESDNKNWNIINIDNVGKILFIIPFVKLKSKKGILYSNYNSLNN